MLKLDTVTLCGVDTRTPDLTLQALQHCMREIRFGAVVLFANHTPALAEAATALGVTLVDPGLIRSVDDYSAFMLRGIGAHLATAHFLVTQWDGFVLHPRAWRDEFLEYDYIGALWRDRSGDLAVGNGGFSLRSLRLVRALSSPQIKLSHPEDLCICEVNRAYLEREQGIRFAPARLAAAFSYEQVRSDQPTFGFHGAFNLPDALDAEQVLMLTRRMTVDMALGADARALAKRLVYGGQHDAAREILRRRLRGGDRRWRTLSLYARLWLRRHLGIGRRRSAP